MTTVQFRPATRVTGRKKAAAIVVLFIAAVVLVGTLRSLGGLLGYQIALNFVGVVALAFAAVLVFRGARQHMSRRLAVILSWLAAFAMIAEAGDHQSRMDTTGALGATNTEYFLSPIVWAGLIALLLAAIAVTDLTKRAKGEA